MCTCNPVGTTDTQENSRQNTCVQQIRQGLAAHWVNDLIEGQPHRCPTVLPLPRCLLRTWQFLCLSIAQRSTVRCNALMRSLVTQRVVTGKPCSCAAALMRATAPASLRFFRSMLSCSTSTT
jgi:hypothetical protein